MMNMEKAKRVAKIVSNKTGLEAVANKVTKGDDVLIGIAVGEVGAKIKPNIYIDTMGNLTDEEVADNVIKVLSELSEQPPVIEDISTTYSNWDKVKDNIYICIRKATENEEDVKEPFLDMELYVRYMIDGFENSQASIVVKKSHLEMWEVDEKTILAKAKENSAPTYTVNDVGNIMPLLQEHKYSDIESETFIEKSLMYVLSNSSKTHGAAVISYKPLINKIACINSENLYIIPSSVHEILVLPESLCGSRDYMKMTIREVNDSALTPSEILSYNLYYFDAKTKEIKIV